MVTFVAISPDGKHALSTGNKLFIWDLVSGECIRTLEGSSYAAFPADGRSVLSGIVLSGDAILSFCLWDLSTGRRIGTFGDGKVWDVVAFSPCGRMMISAGAYGKMKLWELGTGKCLMEFQGHETRYADTCVRSIAFSKDGCFALSASEDRTLRLWDIKNGDCLRTLRGHTGEIFSISLSEDGRYAISLSQDNTMRMWEFMWDYEFPEPADWDEGARQYLEIFLTLHCPYGDDGINRVGKPQWNNEDFSKLLKELQYRGYGWLRPDGVRRELENMTRRWKGPPKLPGISLGSSIARHFRRYRKFVKRFHK